MSKNFISKLFVGILIVLAPVIWLLSIIVPETFGWFNLSYAVAMICAGISLVLLIKGVFRKDNVLYKKANIWLGVGLLVVTLFCLVSAIAIPENIIAPIVCIILGFGLVLCIVGTGGKNWDTADNQKVGYKNYHQRKAEQEKQQNIEENK